MGYGNLAAPNGRSGPARVQSTPAQTQEVERVTAAQNRPVNTNIIGNGTYSFQKDHDDASALLQQFMTDRAQAGQFWAPTVQASTAGAPQTIGYQAPGAIERVGAPQAVTADSVATPTSAALLAGPATQATAQQAGATTIDTGQSAEDRAQQQGFLQQLQRQAAGQGPSVA